MGNRNVAAATIGGCKLHMFLSHHESVHLQASSEMRCCDLVVKQDLMAEIEALNRSQMKNIHLDSCASILD